MNNRCVSGVYCVGDRVWGNIFGWCDFFENCFGDIVGEEFVVGFDSFDGFGIEGCCVGF